LLYDVYQLERAHVWRSAQSPFTSGGGASGEHLTLRHRRTLETLEATVAVWDQGKTAIECRVRPGPASETPGLLRRLSETFDREDKEAMRRFLDEEFGAEPFTLDALFPDDRRRLRELWKHQEKAAIW